MKDQKTGSVIVIGGGIAGIQASLDLADSGYKVFLVESGTAIGGHMAQLDKTFPTNDCAMCTISPRLVAAGTHRNIEIITNADVSGLSGQAGNFKITVDKRARYVDGEKCTGCGACIENCPVIYKAYSEPPEKVKVVLKDGDLERVNPIIEAHRHEDGGLMPILKEANGTFNYLPPRILRYISAEMDIPLSLIYRLATFYNAFSLTPRGRHVISVCMGTSCYVRGADKIMDTLKAKVGEYTSAYPDDKRFSLEAVRCLGCCSLAPVMTVDGETYGNLKQDQLAGILSEYE
ncbi:MAG: NAD(P)H-dependent oxidoreductase subunit E [Planctomycetota bacterium]|jgi:NADH:ubiquinone oxidoreductase subunit E